VNKLCPGCNTVYNVSAPDVGREFSCFKCNTSLVVRKDGIRLAGATPALPGGSEPEAPVAESARLSPGGGADLFRRVLSRLNDVSTWLFGTGAFLVIVNLFFPLINQAKVSRAKAAIQAGQLKDDRAERELKQKMQDKKDVSIADEELRKKARESWAKQKVRMEDDLEELGLDARQSDYWYTWGMMIGFLFLAAAALGYLTPSQPPIRRVVGAIVIVAEVLLIFIKYISLTYLK
jgi:hypothetical protein